MTPLRSPGIRKCRYPLVSKSNSNKTILIAEDYRPNMIILQRMLEGMGFDVTTAENGREAYNEATAHPPDLIFMDILMPVIDGLMAIRMLRASPITREIPIVVFTALSNDGDGEKCLAAGANAYLVKPIEREPLREIVHRFVPVEDNA